MLCKKINKAKASAWAELLTIDDDPWGMPYRIVMNDRLRRYRVDRTGGGGKHVEVVVSRLARRTIRRSYGAMGVVRSLSVA